MEHGRGALRAFRTPGKHALSRRVRCSGPPRQTPSQDGRRSRSSGLQVQEVACRMIQVPYPRR